MEQCNLLPPGRSALTVDELERRLRAAAPAGVRSALRSAEAAQDWPRGDHDLNPDFYQPGQSLTKAAVLVPIVTHDHGLTVLLTRRTDHLHDHAGQVSFPGGRLEAADRDSEDAALRETEEEIGLDRSHIRTVGRLDTYVTRTGFEVTPLVGLVAPPFALAPDDFEVAEVFEVPLTFFLDPSNRQVQSQIYQGVERFFFAYPYGDYFIWGATAGMLVNLTELLDPSC